MTVRVHRLGQLLPGLTVYERLDALLAAFQADRPFDRELLRSMPRTDVDRWNWFAGMLAATNTHLGWYMEFVEATVTQLELRYAILLSLQYAATALDDHMFAILLDPQGDDQRAAILGRQRQVGRLSDALVERIADELAGRWLDVRLAEIAADSVKVACLGRDLLRPEMRGNIEDCKARLLSLKEALKFWREVEMPEPEDAQVKRLLDALEQEATT